VTADAGFPAPVTGRMDAFQDCVPRVRILGDAQQDAGVIGQEAAALHFVNASPFLEMHC
jgi:hypothetical protein